MNEKVCRRIIIGLSILCIGLAIWLLTIYKNGGDTRDNLAETSSQLESALVGITRLEAERDGYRVAYSKIRDEQRKSSSYQRELEDELERRGHIIDGLRSASGEVGQTSERIEDIADEYADLIRQGNEFIADREK